MTLGWSATLLIAVALAFAGVGKLIASHVSGSAIAALVGVTEPRAARALALALGGAELAVATALAGRVAGAGVAAAALLTTFAAVQGGALRRTGTGTPCGCFGPSSRVTPRSLASTGALALVAWALVIVAPPAPSTRVAGWSVAGIALGALAGAVAVALELARRVALLTEQGAPAGALEIASEGPPLGSRPALGTASAPLTLHVFVSPSCGLCRTLAPAIAALATHATAAIAIHDEAADPGAWRAAAVPGSPYAVASDADGIVWAKGAFNTIRQLESVAATAAARRGAAEAADPLAA